MWTIAEALELIRPLQPAIKPFGYHVALAGGVLNKGESDKDLDLVFIPLVNDEAPEVEEIVEYFKAYLGGVDDREDWTTSHKPNPYSPYRHQEALYFADKRIDIFVV